MKPSAKRQRLVDAAAELSHRAGLATASLATIADEADVPVGNIYYYFKSKDDLALAVVDRRRDEYAQLRRAWTDATEDPAERLIQFIDHTSATADQLTAHGCPIGTLCQDLARWNSDLGDAAGEIFADTISWASDNYARLGSPHERDAAIRLVALLQGATVLAHALGDSSVLRLECRRAVDELRRRPS